MCGGCSYVGYLLVVFEEVGVGVGGINVVELASVHHTLVDDMIVFEEDNAGRLGLRPLTHHLFLPLIILILLIMLLLLMLVVVPGDLLNFCVVLIVLMHGCFYLCLCIIV